MKTPTIRFLLWWMLCSAGVCACLSGCGQKDDLYLPETTTTVPPDQTHQ